MASSFPLDPASNEHELAVVFSNAAQFQLFDVPRNFVCSVGANLASSAKSRFLFLFEDVLLIAKADDKQAWDEGAYLILARLDLIDVSVQRESDDTFLVRVDGVGDQRFQLRDKQHLTNFLEKLSAARALRKESVTPRSDSDASPSPSPLMFRRENVWPRGTLMGQAMEEDVSEEFDNRINSQAELVDMVRKAYANDGFLSNPHAYVAIKTDASSETLALDAMRKSLQGTSLESPDLNNARTLNEAKAAILRVFGLSEEHKAKLAAYNAKRNAAIAATAAGTSTAVESREFRERLDKANSDRKAMETDTNLMRMELETTQRSFDEKLSRLERDNALLDMKAADAEDRACLAEDGLAKATSRIEDLESMLEKERSRGAVLKEMLAEQQEQQQRKAQAKANKKRTAAAAAPTSAVIANRNIESVQSQMTKRSSKLVIEKPSSTPVGYNDSNSSMADFSIAEEDLDSILGEFMASPENMTASLSLDAGDQTLRSVPVASSSSSVPPAFYVDLLHAVNILSQELQLGSSDEVNGVKNVERVRTEFKRTRDELAALQNEKKQAIKTAEWQLEQTRKEKQSVETAFRMADGAASMARNENAQLRNEVKALETQLQSAKKEIQVLRDSTHAVADAANAANKGESALKTELREAQREARRLKAELEETQGALKTAQAIADDATERARQERVRGSQLNKGRVDEQTSSLGVVQAKSAAEELRKVVQKHEALRKQLSGALTPQDMLRVMSEQDREIDTALRALESPLGITAAAKTPAGSGTVPVAVTADSSLEVRIQSMKVETARLESSLQQLSSELVEERGKVKTEHVARMEAERLVGIEKAQVAFLEKRVEELTKESRVARDELAALNVRVEREKAVEKKLIATLQQQVSEARSKCEREEKRAAEAVAAVAVSVSRAEAEKERADKLEKKAQESAADKAKVVALEKKIAESEKQAIQRSDMEKLSAIQTQWDAAEARAVAAETQKVLEIKESAIKEAEHRKVLEAKQNEISGLKEDVEDLQGEMVAIKAQLAAALGSCTKLRQEKQELSQKVERLSATVKDLIHHSNETASELRLEKSRSASIRGSPKGSPKMSPHRVASPNPNTSVDQSPEEQLTDLIQQLKNTSEKLEASEKRASNLTETNKALLARLNELQKKK